MARNKICLHNNFAKVNRRNKGFFITMQFNKTKRRYTRDARSGTTVGSAEYTDGLQLYSIPPTETISLQQFEDLAIDRLKGTLFC